MTNEEYFAEVFGSHKVVSVERWSASDAVTITDFPEMWEAIGPSLESKLKTIMVLRMWQVAWAEIVGGTIYE